MISPAMAGAVMAAGDCRLLGTWTAGLAVCAFVIAYMLLPRSVPAAEAKPALPIPDCAPV